jgi:uncharacterized protein DUF6603
MPSSLQSLARQLAIGVATVGQIVSIPQGARTLLRVLGWDTPPGVDDIGLAALDIGDLATKLLDLDVAISASGGSGGVAIDLQYAEIFTDLIKTLSDLRALGAGFSAPADYLSKTNIENEFLPRLFDLLVATQVSAASPFVAMLAQLTGVVTLEQHDADPNIFQVAHVRPVIHWDRLHEVFGSPVQRIQTEYGWGTPAFDADRLIANFGALIELLGVPARFRALPARAEAQLIGSTPPPGSPPLKQLFFSFSRGADVTGLDVGVSLYPLRDGGMGLSPYLRGTSNTTFPLSDTLSATIDSTVDLSSGIAALLRPGHATSITTGLMAGAQGSVPSGHALIKLGYKDASGAKANVLSVSDGFGVQATTLALSGGVDVSGGTLTPTFIAQLQGGRFFIDPTQMDSFLTKLIPISIDVGFDFGVGWSGAYGFFFQGSASPAVTIGLHESIGPFGIDSLHVGLELGESDRLPIELSLTGKATLGPFTVTVDRIGLDAVLTFTSGNLGPVDLSLAFKPPNGLGMELDAGLISGGGYLFIDQPHHRYAGVLECSIADIVQVKIIAVLDTVLPDGTPDFALLLVITTEFPPVQLGFGFTLNGVGGIGGVNRTESTNALRAGFRAHQLDSILFPADPVDNAPQIISNLSSFFPAAGGRYVFGPLFELGWGEPTLITLSVGVILAIPDPVVLVILGEIKMALPTADIPLIELNIDVLGVIDFGAKLLTIQGSLYDSRVTIYSVSGDMALMLGWGDNPNFAFSVGGLNPRFEPPPNFPQLNRCCVSLGLGDNPRLSSNSYYAVTSNSVQFGANVDLYASAGDFSIHGWIGFDALFIFSPFSFVIDFSAGLDVEFDGDSLCSIHVDGTLSGPHQWHVHGEASFHILFIDISASVDLSWGDKDPVTLPPVEVLPQLEQAFANPQSWSTVLPSDATQAVSLTPRPPGDKTLVVHPIGTLEVREKVVPLGQTITKFGNAAPSDGTLFNIASVSVDGRAESQQPLTDQFAIGQFTDLTDDQKLTARSYQPMVSGVSVGSSDVVTSRDVECIIAYQDGYIDGDDTGMRLRQVFIMPVDIQAAYSRLGAGFVSAARTKGVSQFTPPGTTSAVVTGEMQYVIASTDDLSVRSDLLGAPVTQFEAQSVLRAHLKANPAARGSLQVLAVNEVAA